MENSEETPETELPQTEEEPEAKNWWPVNWPDRRAKWVALGSGLIFLTFVVVFILNIDSDESGEQQANIFDNEAATTNDSPAETVSTNDSPAITAGKRLSNNGCEGEGVPYKLSVSPMKPDEFSIIVPYGLMTGGHVTPIDHQYFSPADYKSLPDAYEVRAMADSTIVDISARPRPFGQEYRLVFAVSCTFLYYYDLVTSLTPDIQQAYAQASTDTGSRKSINIPVKAGELIGRIGGQTLDFAVWDTTKPLDGFIVPEHYDAEPWKAYTADPLDYYTEELKDFILTRYVRTVPPISGEIDYDVDGQLIGNWFLEGTGGYSGDRLAEDGSYWTTHLSFAPNHYVPDWFVVSIGDFEQGRGPGSQFVAVKNFPNPRDVSVESGLVKYDLSGWGYFDESGGVWDRSSLAESLTIRVNSSEGIQACALVQMLETRTIKFEVTRDQSCSEVTDFSPAAKIYTR